MQQHAGRYAKLSRRVLREPMFKPSSLQAFSLCKDSLSACYCSFTRGLAMNINSNFHRRKL